jgi:hypothetical protein
MSSDPRSQLPHLLAAQATWSLRTELALPWRPLVDIDGSTKYTLSDRNNQVVEHVESWRVSGMEALLQLRPGGRR